MPKSCRTTPPGRALLIDVLTGQQPAAMADGLGEVARRLGAADD
jgi:hypothetical protein